MQQNLLNNDELKQNPFAVPDGYFSAVKNDVLAKTIRQSKTISINRRKRNIVYSAAASLLLLIATSWFFLNQSYSNELDYLANGIEDELYEYNLSLLESYASEGLETELMDQDDYYLVNTGISDDEFLKDNY